MRVSFFGKGGSGKTTVATSFVKFAENLGKDVVAIDGDVNTHLGRALKMDQIYLGDRLDEIGEYFEENRNVEKPMVMIGTTPPDFSTNFITPTINDKFFDKFASKKNNTALITVGSYTEEGIGYDCYHSKLGSSEIIYNRLLDNENMLVITDGTAGVDSVGTATFLVSDINVFVVEPTKKSIEVFEDFENLTKNYNLKNYVVINKAMDDEDIEFVENIIGKDKIIGVVPYSKHLKRYEQGDLEALDKFSLEMKDINEKIYENLKTVKRDWTNYHNQMNSLYIKNCENWYNDYYGKDLKTYINPEFSYEKQINNMKF